jgi:ArsR family transcriptional regulator
LDNQIYTHRAEIVKALAHPLRLEIIDLLKSGKERCVCELVEALEGDQPTVSKHLSLLKSVGLVTSRKDGTKVLYQLRTPCIVNFLECIDRVLLNDLEIKQQELASIASCQSKKI